MYNCLSHGEGTTIYLHLANNNSFVKIAVNDRFHKTVMCSIHPIPNKHPISDALHFLMSILRGQATLALPVTVYINRKLEDIDPLVQEEIDDYFAENKDRFTIKKLPSILRRQKHLKTLIKLAKGTSEPHIVRY